MCFLVNESKVSLIKNEYRLYFIKIGQLLILLYRFYISRFRTGNYGILNVVL